MSTGRNGKRSNTGCLTCRQRKKKCDELRPVCSGCKRQGIDCSWEDYARRKPRLHRPQRFNHDFAIPSEISNYVTVFAAPSMTLQQRLVSHFIATCPNWISSVRVSDGAGFLNYLIPMAMGNCMVMDCLLAVAAGDLGKIGVESVELERLSHQHYGVATAALSSAIASEMQSNDAGSGSHSSDDTLIAALLLCVHEAVNFTSSELLLTHINGAATLVAKRLNHLPENADLRGFLLELFCYFFTLAATTHGRQMKLDTQFAFQIFHWPLLQKHQSQGMLLGSSPELFYIILRLSAVLKSTSFLRSDQDSTQSELSSIETDLEKFSLDQTATSHHHSERTGPELTEAQLTSKLYYLACKLQLSQAMHPSAPISDEPRQEIVSAFFATLEKLPISSSTNGVLCWPLFITGLSTITGKYRSAILVRLRRIETGWRSSIALQTSKYLSRQWKECKNGESVLPATITASSVFGNIPMILV